MRKILLVVLGGGAGTLLRFLIGEKVAMLHQWPPLATLVINVSGCFLISFLNFISKPPGHIYIGPRSRLLWIVGFCGGYTMFSTFSLISFNAIRKSNWSDVWGNILLSQLLCIGAVWIGYTIRKPAVFMLAKVSDLLCPKVSSIVKNTDA